MRSRKTHTCNPVHCGDVVNQCRKIRVGRVVHRTTIGVDILTQQVDLSYTLFRQLHHFGYHVVERSADLLATGVRHHAESTVLAAALHNRNESRRTLCAWCRQSIEFLDFRETDVDDGAATASR